MQTWATLSTFAAAASTADSPSPKLFANRLLTLPKIAHGRHRGLYRDRQYRRMISKYRPKAAIYAFRPHGGRSATHESLLGSASRALCPGTFREEMVTVAEQDLVRRGLLKPATFSGSSPARGRPPVPQT